MAEFVVCPECGSKVVKGSTHCLNCGTRLTEGQKVEQLGTRPVVLDSQETTKLDSLASTMTKMLAEDELGTSSQPDKERDSSDVTLPPIDEDLLGDDPDTAKKDEMPKKTLEESEPQTASEKSTESLEWDVVSERNSATDDNVPISPETETETPMAVDAVVTKEIEVEDIKVGNPFKEIEPPKPVDSEVEMPVRDVETFELLAGIPESSEKIQAVKHLFPEGKAQPTKEFIEATAGTKKRITISKPMREIETPSCPNCGAILTGDDFEYPPYVFEAMGRARIEHGEKLLKNNEHEKAIEEFERAKVLYNKANNQKLVEAAARKVDEGYEAMASFHYTEGEKHLREKEFEWAIVQFEKARQLYMYTSLAKMRAKCAEKARESYVAWGEFLEKEGDKLVKQGNTRLGLTKYQEAAEKYRKGDSMKKLRGLEKKIRRV